MTPAPAFTDEFPNLPGFKLQAQYQREQFHKGHTLDYNNGYQVNALPVPAPSDELSAQELAKFLEQSQIKIQYGERPLKLAPKMTVAMWNQLYGKEKSPEEEQRSKFENVVLTFNAYLRETIPDGVRVPALGVKYDSVMNSYTIRRVVIRYFMENDTLSISEPPLLNSGLTAGLIFQRAKAKATPESAENVTYKDIDVGKILVVYGKQYHVVSADPYTEKFYKQQLDRTLSSPIEALPEDPYVHARAVAKESMVEKKTHHETDSNWLMEKRKRFIEHSGKVLRFYCTWDDSKSMYGEVKFFELHYYFVDGTCEVREIKTKNSDLDSCPILAKRQLLPKVLSGMTDLATSTPIGTDNDSKIPKAEQFYTWTDLKIGAEINVLGRRFVINDVDGFTRTFYVEHGLPQGEAILHQKAQSLLVTKSAAKDEVNMLFKIAPEKTRKNLSTVLACENKSLSFGASIINTKNSYDLERKFVVSLRLTDDMITVYEPAARVAGMMGGKLADRVFAFKPETNRYYKPSDMFVGAEIHINGRVFALNEADEFSINWMKNHPNEFPFSDLKSLVPKFQALQKENAKLSAQKLIPNKEFREILLASAVFNKHEIATLAQEFSQNGVVNLDAISPNTQ